MMHQRPPLSNLAGSVPVIFDTPPKPGIDRASASSRAMMALGCVAAGAMLILAALAAFWPYSGTEDPLRAHARPIMELRGRLDDMPASAGISAKVATETIIQHTATPNQAVIIPGHPTRTALLLLHIAGLVLGFGSALFLDLYLLTRLYRRPIQPEAVELLHFGSHLVLAGLVMLWVSGLGFLAFYATHAPDALANPKLAAKIVVVVALTLNGVLLHQIVLPRVRESIGRPLLRGRPLQAALLPLTAGVVSGTSWAAAVLFGMMKEFNYVVPAALLLAGYFAVVIVGIAAAAFFHRLFTGLNRMELRFGQTASAAS